MKDLYLVTAVFCEDAEQAANRSMTIERIYAGAFEVTPKPNEGPTLRREAFLLVGLAHSGAPRPPVFIEVEQVSPWQEHVGESAMTFDEGVVAFLKFRLLLRVSREGLYWYDLRVDGETMARIPLVVQHLRPILE